MKKFIFYIAIITLSIASYSQGIGVNTDGTTPATDVLFHLKNHKTSTSSLMRIQNMQNGTNGITGLEIFNSQTGNLSRWRIYNPNGASGNLIFRNNTTDRITFTNLGRVGIGTTAPTELLQVNGNIRATGQIYGSGPDGGSVIRAWQGNSGYAMFGTKNMTGGEYALITNGTNTYVSAGSGGAVTIRGSANNSANELRVTTSGSTIGGQTIWHRGNDGAGSGLDADLIDGIQSSGLVQSGNDPFGGNLNGADYRLSTRMVSDYVSYYAPNNVRGWYTIYNNRHRGGVSDGYNWGSQIAIGMTANRNRMFFRNQYNGSWEGWKEVTTSGTPKTKTLILERPANGDYIAIFRAPSNCYIDVIYGGVNNSQGSSTNGSCYVELWRDTDAHRSGAARIMSGQYLGDYRIRSKVVNQWVPAGQWLYVRVYNVSSQRRTIQLTINYRQY